MSTDMTSASKDALLERLASLLGLDKDSALDVLDHLLSIESESDLIDYLSQLTGNDSDIISNFAKDVTRFHSGESIQPQTIDQSADSHDDERQASQSVPPKVTNKSSSSRTSAETRKNLRLEQGRGGNRKKSKTPPPPKQKKKESQNTPSRANDSSSTTPSRNEPTMQPKPKRDDNLEKKTATSMGTNADSTVANAPIETKKAAPPKRGKATIICGCFGTKHKSLTNCLYCGRISCEKEGYSYCPFCGFFIEKQTSTNQKEDAAWLHKERLLRFDRDFARRTTILDDQADHDADVTSAWKTKQEQREAQQAQEEKQQQQQRKKQQLNIVF